MSEDYKEYQLDALEVFRIVRKWKKKLNSIILFNIFQKLIMSKWSNYLYFKYN